MRNINIKGLLSMAFFALAISSCDEIENSSVVTSFEKYPVTMGPATTPMTIPEDEAGIYVFEFVLDDRQITDVHIVVAPGSSSTATEGVDFEIVNHDIELLAFQGQDGFEVEIEVLEDLELEAEDETIYLSFTTQSPSGIESTEMLAITIQDSGLDGVGLELSWEFDSDVPTTVGDIESCDLDVDFTIQAQGADPYDSDDLLGYGMASSACPEHAKLSIDDMVDGEVYDLWVLLYGTGDNFGEYGGVTVHIDYDRIGTGLKGSFAVEGVFDVSMEEAGAIVATIEKNGDIVTIKTLEGDVVSEGRVGRKIELVNEIAKPSFLVK